MNTKNKTNQWCDLTPAVTTGAFQAKVTTIRKVETVSQDSSLMEIIQRIDISAQDKTARELQKKAFEAISNSLRKWESGWTIKLPTGTGKTYVFAKLLQAFCKNGLILVPRVDLYTSTARDLQAVGFDKDRDILAFIDDHIASGTQACRQMDIYFGSVSEEAHKRYFRSLVSDQFKNLLREIKISYIFSYSDPIGEKNY